MILADKELACRIDGFEARGSKAIGEASVRRDPGRRAFSLELGEGVAVYAGPGSPANKIIGVGFNAGLKEAELERIELEFFARGSPIQAEVATLALPAVHALFTERGYVLQGFENVLARRLEASDAFAPDSAGITIEAMPLSALAEWADVVITGFEHPDASGAGSGVAAPPRHAVEEAFKDFAETPGFQACLARIEGIPAGGAGLRIDGGIAQLCGASTLPAYRRRGIQAALMRYRLLAARSAGCDLAIMTAQPGSKSHFNAQRLGFALLYSRAILVKEPPL